eukprot:TRINITY_DN8257_c0_g1_i1.p1 TRINITY_DN8257_c0_g1~~TRINITY_DN8257_c0_g1_i1.p1  ORF type:complete len:472 (-),score=86.54 TRINITY_DN8257_c0_g1_i1:2-1417(-)
MSKDSIGFKEGINRDQEQSKRNVMLQSIRKEKRIFEMQKKRRLMTQQHFEGVMEDLNVESIFTGFNNKKWVFRVQRILDSPMCSELIIQRILEHDRVLPRISYFINQRVLENQQLSALWCFACISGYNIDQHLSTYMSMMPVVINECVASSSVEKQNLGIQIIGNLACEADLCDDLISMGALDCMLDIFLNPRDLHVRWNLLRNCAWSISNLVRNLNYDNYDETHHKIFVSIFKYLVGDHPVPEKEEMIWMAGTLSTCIANLEYEIMNTFQLKHLFTLGEHALNLKNYSIVYSIIRFLGNIAASQFNGVSEFLNELLYKNYSTFLLSALHSDGAPKILLQEIMFSISNMALESSEIRRVLVNECALDVINILSGTYPLEVKKEALTAILNMMLEKDTVQKFFEQEGILISVRDFLLLPDIDIVMMSLTFIEVILRNTEGNYDIQDLVPELETLSYSENDMISNIAIGLTQL